jgi:phosphatidylglycerol---prolipoprotein diacylglyceryl transferase
MQQLLLIHWDVSPVLFEVGGIEVRWYGLLFALAFLSAMLIMKRIFDLEGKSQQDLDRLSILIIAATIIGARLGHVLFYDFHYYFVLPFEQYAAYMAGKPNLPPDVPTSWFAALVEVLLGVLNVRGGGLASHGAAISILLAMWWYSKSRPDQPFLWVADRIVITVALGGAFVRLGNLMNSEICGNLSSVEWAFQFVRGGSDCSGGPRHPTQIYEAISCLIIFGLLLALYRKHGRNTPHGLLLGLFLVTLFTSRLAIEFLKVPQESFQHGLPLNVGQLLSLPFIGIGIYLLAKVRKPAEDTAA